MVVIVNEVLDGYTLDEFVGLLKQYNIKKSVPKQFCISMFLTMLQIIAAADKVGILLGSLLPDSILIYKGTTDKENSGSNYDLKISVTSKHPLFCGKSKLEHLYPSQSRRNLIDGEIWGAGISLYALIGVRNLNEIPVLREIYEKDRIKQLPIKYNDPALEHMLKRTLKDANSSSIFDHSFIRIWTGLCKNDPVLIENTTFKELHALNSGIQFENDICKALSIKKMLEIATERSSETYQYLIRWEIFNNFLRACIFFDWISFPNLLDSLFLILNHKVPSQNFKEFLTEIGFLSLLPITIVPEVNPIIVYDFVLKFMENNTLTILQIIRDNRILDKILARASKVKDDEKFIRSTMPYYGPHSIEIIESAYYLLGINEDRAIQALLEVPYYFKLENYQTLVKMLQSMIKRGVISQKNQDSITDMLKAVVLIIGELLVLPNFLQSHHIRGICISHSSEQFLSYLGKNPLLVECLDCGIPLCTICFSLSHMHHKCKFLHYFQAHFRCACAETHEIHNTDPAQFLLPRYNQQFVFVMSNGKNQAANTFKSNGYLKVTTSEPLINSWNEMHRGVVAYFEVKILRAGTSESIVIELDGTGASYNSLTGIITNNFVEVGKGPRFGSYDTVGMGLTSNNRVFVTFNGLIVHPLINVEAKQEIKPIVTLNGDGYEIEIRLRNWMLHSAESTHLGLDIYSTELLKECEPLLDLLIKRVNKLIRKNCDTSVIDLVEKFREILITIRKPNLMEKLKKIKKPKN